MYRNLIGIMPKAVAGPAPGTIQLDNFDDNSINTGLWQVSGVTVSETGGMLQISGTTVAHLRTISAYNWTGKMVGIQFITVPSPNAGYAQQFLLADGDALSNYYLIQVYNSNLAFVVNGGVLYTVAYNSTTHAYFRISFSGGNVLFDTSTDGSSWTNRYTGAVTITITALYAYLRDFNSGTSVTHKWDNFNSDQ